MNNYIDGALNALDGCVGVLDIIEMFDDGKYEKEVARLKKDVRAIIRFAEKVKVQYNMADYLIFKVRVSMFIRSVVNVKKDARLESRIDMEYCDV